MMNPPSPPRPYRMTALLAVALCLLSAPAPAQPVSTHTVGVRDIDVGYAAEGVIEAVRQATVAAQVAGRVMEVRAEIGQKVNAGDLLMRIDAREATQAAAAAEAQLAQAKANYTRNKNLFSQKFVSANALDKAEADYKAALANAAASGAGASHAAVTAPIAGIIAARETELGEMAALGKPLITVFDPRSLRVIATVPQYKLAEIRKTRRARLEFPETGGWQDISRLEILPTADARSHTVTVRLYLPENIENVIPGMAVRVHFAVGAGKKLTVPARAVIRRGEVTAVYVVDGDKPARLRQVRLGETMGNGELEVLAGLSGGETVSLTPVETGIRLKQAAAAK